MAPNAVDIAAQAVDAANQAREVAQPALTTIDDAHATTLHTEEWIRQTLNDAAKARRLAGYAIILSVLLLAFHVLGSFLIINILATEPASANNAAALTPSNL
ncbi:unnamed protein product [Zymoseptoria tritici ST99CH_3D1]|nr:unnamed protein product [Zymoseptoria tritici ST99CH_3D1]